MRRLVGLAGRQFDARIRERIDVEDLVASACKSFFLRCRQDAFEMADWDELWALLAMITLRKCQTRREHARAARRDPFRERSWAEAEGREGPIPDRGPTPEEAAMFSETVEQLFGAAEPRDRAIVEMVLAGYPAGEISESCDCSVRTVGRVRRWAKDRLIRQLSR